ncbi:hypothetical protein [Alienimonas californiensis]|uniref:TIGR03545 family protein n=1 Tax=Alienimonas californiensis TaxID=2527989 RepID=A0A517PFU9_9PLAN|nr:hypothetical protein [Alienimonas californiensis]QDT18241.1 hypothetical protein CA12_43820 [Alienimonas californiensis]
MTPPRTEPQRNRVPLLNRRYLLPRAVLAAGLWVFLAFGFDPLLRSTAVQTVGRLTGSRPDLAEVRTAAFPPRIDLSGFALPDPERPGRNLIAFDRLTADLDAAELLRGRTHVTAGTLTGLTFGTPRETPAEGFDALRLSLPEPSAQLPVCEGLEDFEGALGELPDLLREGGPALGDELETVRVARRLHGEWDGRLDELTRRSAELDARSAGLSERMNAAAAVADPLKRLERLATLTADAATLAADAETLRRELPALAAQAGEDRAALAAAKQRDAERLKTLADAARLDADAAARSLLGPALSQRLMATLAVTRWLRERLGEPDALAAPPPPRRGVRVPFPSPDPRPALLLENLAVTGALPTADGPIPFAGTLTGLTSDPALHGGPVAGSFTALADPHAADAHGSAPRFAVLFTHDASAGEPVTDVELRVAATVPRAANATVGTVPVPIVGVTDDEPAGLNWTARLRLTGRGADADLRGAVDLRLTGRLGVGDDESGTPPGETALARTVNAAAATLDGLNGSLHLSGPAARPDWRLETDAGDLLVAGLRETAEQAAAERTTTLLAQADATEAEFLANLSGRWGEATAGLSRVAAVARRLGGETPTPGGGTIQRTAARVPANGSP